LPCHRQGVAEVFDSYLCAKDEFAHALERGLENLARQYAKHAACMGQQIYERQHPALRARIRGKERNVIGKPLRVVGQLTLQELNGIGACES
jgi:hypothetical protein